VHREQSVKREKTNKMQQLDVYYQLLSQHVSGIIMPIFRMFVFNMAAGKDERVFSALCFGEKTRLWDMSEFKYCINMEKELKELQEELSSAKLVIKLLQSESNPTECASYNTIEPQCSYVNANKTKEDKRSEVVSGHRRRTNQRATSKVLDKRQVEMDNRYHVLRNLKR
jgi:hypothetical protein